MSQGSEFYRLPGEQAARLVRLVYELTPLTGVTRVAEIGEPAAKE